VDGHAFAAMVHLVQHSGKGHATSGCVRAGARLKPNQDGDEACCCGPSPGSSRTTGALQHASRQARHSAASRRDTPAGVSLLRSCAWRVAAVRVRPTTLGGLIRLGYGPSSEDGGSFEAPEK